MTPVHSSNVDDTTRPGLDRSAFTEAMSRFASGVTIVTTVDPDGVAHGFTASSFCSVSLDPPLVLVCLARSANSYAAFAGCDRFSVSVLRADQADLALRFARRGTDKFSNGRFVTGTGGVAAVDGALALLECTSDRTFDAGDHVILLGRVHHARVDEGSPAIYFNRTFRTLVDR
ncbi:flavin reductase family protein [Micromonospora sp. NPDC004540]|uniref:flavin reductase family protein n=1 Tax=Micromonospora sp. NPDC004540 TaxID=3154457 RepID=UPI0033B309B7